LSLTLSGKGRSRVFEDGVLRKIFGTGREDITRYNEELHNLYTLPNITRMIKLRRMRWVGHIAGMKK